MSNALEIHAHRAEDSFDHAVRAWLRSAPWLLVSGLFHLMLLLIAAQFPWTLQRASSPVISIHAANNPEIIDPILTQPKNTPAEPTIDSVPAEDPVPPSELTEVTEADDDPVPVVRTPDEKIPEGRDFSDILGVGGVGGVGGVAGSHGPRSGGGRKRAGPPASHQAVSLGLDWLKRHQDPLGFWSCASFSDQCRTNLCDGGGDVAHDVGVTGLALLAFLGSGHTASHGEHRELVRNGLRYLVRQQDPETGCFGELNGHQAFLYDHALAALAVTEGYGLSRWPLLKEPAQRGVDFALAARNRYKAWRYASPPNGENDACVTGWMVMVLKSAEDFGLRVEPEAKAGALLFLDELTDPNTGRTGYLTPGGYSAREPGLDRRWPANRTEAITAVAMLCRVFMGEDPEQSRELKQGAALLAKQLPVFDEQAGSIDYYYWYYGSYALFQMAGRDWDRWQKALLPAVIRTQRREGDEQGSWDPQLDPWGHRGGRVYSTAILTLCLEVYYRYDRVLGGR